MPFFSLTPDDVLGQMITPAVLISASGTLSLSTSNRLGRVVDRVRVLGDEAWKLDLGDKLPHEMAAKKDLITGQLARLVRRIGLLQNALTAVYVAVGLLVGTSLTVGLSAAVPAIPPWVSVATALGGGTALFVASVFLILEARLAVRASLLEMYSIQEVLDRKAGWLPGR